MLGHGPIASAPIAALGVAIALTADTATLVAGSTGNTVVLTLVGATFATPGTPGSPTIGISSTGSGEAITAQTIDDPNQATLTVDAGTTGVITLSDPDSGATVTIAVVAASAGIHRRAFPRGLTRGLLRAAA